MTTIYNLFNCILLFSFYLIYLCSVSPSTLSYNQCYSSLYPQNMVNPVDNDHSPRYNYHHIYMVHILKQLFMMNYIDTFHGSCISAVENLYQHYLILHLCNILIILLPYVLLWLSLNQFLYIL